MANMVVTSIGIVKLAAAHCYRADQYLKALYWEFNCISCIPSPDSYVPTAVVDLHIT